MKPPNLLDDTAYNAVLINRWDDWPPLPLLSPRDPQFAWPHLIVIAAAVTAITTAIYTIAMN